MSSTSSDNSQEQRSSSFEWKRLYTRKRVEAASWPKSNRERRLSSCEVQTVQAPAEESAA